MKILLYRMYLNKTIIFLVALMLNRKLWFLSFKMGKKLGRLILTHIVLLHLQRKTKFF